MTRSVARSLCDSWASCLSYYARNMRGSFIYRRLSCGQ